MLIPLLFINLFDIWLINKLFKKYIILYISALIPLSQSILVLVRFLLSNEEYTDPTLSISISMEESYQIMFIFSLFILLILIPFLYFIRKLNIFPFNCTIYSLQNLIAKGKNSSLYIQFSCLFYPLWGITAALIKSIDLQIWVKLFGAGWFFLPLLSKKEKFLPFTIFLLSLPILYKTGNRTCFVYPLASYFLGSLFLNKKNDSSKTKLNLLTLFNPKKILKIAFYFFLALALLFISLIIRYNRLDNQLGFNYGFFNQISIFIEFSDLNLLSEIIVLTLNRIIFWQYISAIILNPLIGIDGFIRELLFVYSPLRSDMQYMIQNNISLGIVQLAGWATQFGYTVPNNITTEGAIRFGQIGGVIYYILYLSSTILFANLARFFRLSNVLLVIFITTSLIINLNQDSLAQSIKTNIYFILFTFLLQIILGIFQPKRKY